MGEGQYSQRSMVYLSVQHMYSDCSHGPESDSRHLPVLALKLIYTASHGVSALYKM